MILAPARDFDTNNGRQAITSLTHGARFNYTDPLSRLPIAGKKSSWEYIRLCGQIHTSLIETGGDFFCKVAGHRATVSETLSRHRTAPVPIHNNGQSVICTIPAF